jgi:hypothetical protein
VTGGLLIYAVTLICSAEATATESVRAELIRLQSNGGLTLAWQVDTQGSRVAARAVWFKSRTLVPLDDSTQVSAPQGFNPTECPKLSGTHTGWSHGQTKLVSINYSHGGERLDIIGYGRVICAVH